MYILQLLSVQKTENIKFVKNIDTSLILSNVSKHIIT